MIIIDFITSPDNQVKGTHQFSFKTLHLGQSLANDIIIQDDQVSQHHVTLYEKEGKLFIRSARDEQVFTLNGKKVIGTQGLKIGDTLKIGATEFKISSHIPQQNLYADFSQQYSKTIDDDPELESICRTLEKELIIIERKSNE